ncbi:MAG: response regulator [Elusimicrobia bacterium RIFOXYB2_FULL_62_6]|nr:MAG: response regulator [Elusimicrobia bacterium RIFOXYB2_FULL_62_6]
MSDTDPLHSIEILLVEDNPGDARLTVAALEEEKLYSKLHVVTDGAAALAFIRKEGEYAGRARPDLILLDLNLPKKDGLEVLKEIKCDGELKRIPVVVLTLSEAESDILKAYDLHANCYITKPVGLAQFTHVARSLQEFWLTTVRLPPNPA